jgi:hypothetical protein
MKIKTLFIAFLVLILNISVLFSNVTATDTVTIQVNMLDGTETTRFDKPVVIAGVWHYVNITIVQNVDDFTLRFYKGNTPPTGTKNETNYYEWKYDKNSATEWEDISGYGMEYIKPEYCGKNDNMYSFYIGLDDTFPNIVGYCENWTGDVYSNGNKLHSEGIVIEKLATGISRSDPSSIIFYVDPFTEMDAQGDNFFKIGNTGNIPLSLELDYEQYAHMIEITDFNQNVSPGEVNTYYVILHSRSWSPGIREMSIDGVGSYPKTYFISNATVALYSAFVIDIPLLVIYVGHSNYKITEIPDTGITFQHLEQVNMYEGEIRDIKAYVSGNGTVRLEVSADGQNIRLLKLFDGTTETSSPLNFISTSTSERMINAQIEAISEGTTGILTYMLTCDGTVYTYTTEVIIGPPSQGGSGISASPDFIGKIIVVIIVLLVVLYMVYSYLKHKRR